ncbi:MAG: LysR family transcriptional regulator [Betaproteobacteria bacterium]|nr:LysR family transcriptional regulator [Betaproteobacteria bacterium]
MNIANIDLNLILAFNAMYEHRNVTRAGEALSLSQPAMSAAVGRLRVLFDDPLFVRSGLEMRPTPRALELGPTIQQVIQTLQNDILQPIQFKPCESKRVFTLLTPDIGEANFLPSILTMLAKQAPQINLRTLAMPRHLAAESLESGAAELAIGYFPDLKKTGFFQQTLMRSSHICLIRKKHPITSQKMSQSQFMSYSHVVVKPDGREHVFEKFLNQIGIKRRVHLEISHFMSLLPIVESSDLIATVPKDLAEFCVSHGDVRMMEPPFKAPIIDVQLFWHRRFQKDPGHAWLRKTIHELFSVN